MNIVRMFFIGLLYLCGCLGILFTMFCLVGFAAEYPWVGGPILVVLVSLFLGWVDSED